MSSTPAATPNFPLSPPVLSHMISSVLGTLSHSPEASAADIATQRHAALHAIAALRPRDPIEAMLAARCVVANEAGFDTFRRAAQPNLPVDALARLRGKAISLWRLADDIMRELRFRQSRAPLQVPEVPQPEAAPASQSTPAAPTAASPSALSPQAARPATPTPAADKHPLKPEPVIDLRVGEPRQTRASLHASVSTAALLCDAARPRLPGQAAAAPARRVA